MEKAITIWIVNGVTDDYDDSRTWSVAAYANRDTAVAMKTKLEEEVLEMQRLSALLREYDNNIYSLSDHEFFRSRADQDIEWYDVSNVRYHISPLTYIT